MLLFKTSTFSTRRETNILIERDFNCNQEKIPYHTCKTHLSKEIAFAHIFIDIFRFIDFK